ncbi:Tobamovirus multiplication protein 2A [Vitis vinifera]|uniref:Tobamovirus multiplication protein 2A n=1 Tax=Vitis vinifera TaxID=29760 RepID=A0A438ITU3_VITVI|nr:Tobamovirus multiplication protein 2A [Vitis vinifera]
MACRGCLECLLKILNFLLTLVGLAMVGYGIYLFVEYKKSSSETLTISPVMGDSDVIQLGRPVMMAVTLSSSILDNLPKACEKKNKAANLDEK